MAKATNKGWTTTNKSLATTSSGLSSPGWLARRPMVGLAMILIGGLMFGALAYDVEMHGTFFQQDAPLSKTLYNDAARQPERIKELLIFGFFVGKELVQVIAVILVLYFLHKRFWPELAMLLIGLGGGALIWYFLIGVFNRPRPVNQIGITVTDPSFPSGHMISSILCYGFLAYLFLPKMPSPFWKWVLVIATILTIVYVGASRLVLGGHYLTDILAGTGLGIAWAGLTYTLIERSFLRMERKNGR